MIKSLEQFFEEARGLLKRASVDKRHPMRFCILASQRTTMPSQRYVVLRKIDEEDRLVLFTAGRSSKALDLAENPNASALFYHPGQRLQVRVEGEVSLHRQDEVSQHYWPMVQGEAWKAYGSELAPGTVIKAPEDAYQWSENLAKSQFIVMKLAVTAIEVLQLDGLTHKRASFKKLDETWAGQWLVP